MYTYGTAHVKLDYRTVSLGSTRKFSKTTRKLDATTQTCLKELTHESRQIAQVEYSSK